MARFGWWTGAAVALVALALGLSAARTASAQQPVTLPMQVTENRAPGAAGQVTMTPLGNNQVRVDIRITGLPAGEQRAAHIHTAAGARCDNGAPVTYPLTNVSVDAGGVGTSSTTITLAADRPIQANNAYVNVHQGNVGAGAGAGVGVICANITTSFTAGAAGQAAPAGMTRAGTGLSVNATGWGAVLAGLAAVALLLGGAGALAAARRR